MLPFANRNRHTVADERDVGFLSAFSTSPDVQLAAFATE